MIAGTEYTEEGLARMRKGCWTVLIVLLVLGLTGGWLVGGCVCKILGLE
jgi:hypothetical protein